ncbi:type II toxin-antitoxin system RelN family antitoxin [Anabaena sp. WFMT]|uniref:type II toxin-antitoxin system RelN family antitoxin n=1 Tax=Anabaena sp. WFMT TaxID=3449730 RepID=UPI003F267E0B
MSEIQEGQLTLDYPLEIDNFNAVKVIILLPEADDYDLDDIPIEEVKESLTRAFEEVKSGKARPISELWKRIESEWYR